MSFWKSLADTAKSLGGAVAAPFGTTWDLATAAFDDQDDNFGTLADKVAHGAIKFGDPFTNEQTWTGAVFAPVMQALDTVYREGVSEPISTVNTMLGHVTYDPSNIGDAFDSQSWSKAYQVAQHRSIGQSFWTTATSAGRGLMGEDFVASGNKGLRDIGLGFAQSGTLDPMDERAYKQIHNNSPVLSTFGSGTSDFIARWYLDPGVRIGKGVKAGKAALGARAITPADRVDLLNKLNTESAKKLGVPQFVHNRKDPKTRIDQWLAWSDGKSASVIHRGTPELANSGDGQAIAGLLTDADKITDELVRRDAKRRILAVAGGDVSQIKRLEDEIAEAGSIADGLKNLKRGTTLELAIQGLVPSARNNPAFVADLDRQLANLNNDGDIAKLVARHEDRLKLLQGTQDMLTELPGVTTKGKRLAAREEGQGLLRGGQANTGHDVADRALDATAGKVADAGRAMSQWSKDFAENPGTQTLFQKSVHHVPLLAVKSIKAGAYPYVKGPQVALDAMRQVHFNGMLEIHDWTNATDQLDSMLRIGGADNATRLNHLTKAYQASTEMDKVAIATKVEQDSIKAAWAKYGEKTAKPEDAEHLDYIQTLLNKAAGDKAQQLAQLRGRVYSATKDPAAAGAEGFHPRVDMIDEHGTPMALLETQLTNKIPLADINLIVKVLKRDSGHLINLARGWKTARAELGQLNRLKAMGGTGLESVIEHKQAAMDMAVDAGQRAMRAWKMSVLFRLGYPIRVVSDDQMRISTQLNIASMWHKTAREAGPNAWYNQVGKRREAKQFMDKARKDIADLRDMLDGEHPVAYENRRAEIARLNQEMRSHRSRITKWTARLDEAETKHSLGLDHGVDLRALRENIRKSQEVILEKQGGVDHLSNALGQSPDDIKNTIAGLEERLEAGKRAFRDELDTRHIGTKQIELAGRGPGGEKYYAEGAFANPYGQAAREATSSQPAFEAQMAGAEDRTRMNGLHGSHRIFQSDDPAHLIVWADVINHQLALSKVAKHFMRGGSVDEFATKLKSPEWADLRARLPHYAHDPEDWGHRVQMFVRDYLPTDDLRQAVGNGKKITPGDLRKAFPDEKTRPAVHGSAAAYNLGDVSNAAHRVGKGINNMFRYLSEVPTDRLSRHPFFNAMYNTHMRELHSAHMAAHAKLGIKYTQADIERLTIAARKLAMNDLRRTLWDISAHSHAAHMMRFVSPFFSAHVEGLSRWWRIATDDPSVVRKFQLAFDMPRKVGLVYDSTTGEPIKPGEAISTRHRILLRVPKALGGGGGGAPKGAVDKFLFDHFDNWSVGENSFNLILQSGLMNPGSGPLVSMPVEALAKKYADQPEIERVARVMNPYPPDSPLDPMMPATLQRTLAFIRKDGDPEYARAHTQNAMDLTVKFEELHGRPPNKQEAAGIMVRAGRQTNVDSFLRILWNATSPAPARPESKYAVVQNGWSRISEQAKAEGKDFTWARDRFKEKYGDIYMPLIYSMSTTAAGTPITAEGVAATKRHRGLLRKIDPSLTRMVLGAEGEGEYSVEARAWFKDAAMQAGDTATYISDKNPKQAMVDEVVRQGWDKYTALTGALTAMAQENGLNSWRDSTYLTSIRRAATDKIAQENPLWWHDYNGFNRDDFEQSLGDMQVVANNPALQDTGRQDIQALKAYLQLRSQITEELARRKAAGLPYTPDANANQPLLAAYSQAVGKLVEQVPDFEKYMFDGTIDRDPLLIGG